ncbi:hypothetical protein [Myroides sp. TSA_177.3]|uniref:hypothetical protein n=1 Tax=Myroides sp. TSA_177.3 TaxID=3415650 RepID=UPI0040455EB8
MDPLEEQFPAWTPYHYVHNNPINLVDPTGMAADGWIINEKSGEAKFNESYDGTNTPDGWYYGSAIIGDKTIYNADGTHQPIDSGSENCVSCHHDVVFGPQQNKDLSGNLGGYRTWGGGTDDNGRKKGSIFGIHKDINAGDMNMLVGAGGASLPDLNSFFTAMSGLQKVVGGFIGGYSAAEKIMDDIENSKPLQKVSLYNGYFDSIQIQLNDQQARIMKDYYAPEGGKFRDSLRKQYFDFNAHRFEKN